MIEQFINADWRSTNLKGVDLVICDPIYGSKDLSYISSIEPILRPGGSIYIFGDYARIAETKIEADKHFRFRNWLIWGPNDWGGRSKTKWPQKHDDILYYVKSGGPVTFSSERVQVAKKMLHPVFNPSGRKTKTPNSVWADLGGFHTTAKERVKMNGKCVRWQKPEKVIERIILASSDEGDLVFDPFGGVATVPVVCSRTRRQFVSYEIDDEVYRIGMKRLERVKQT